MRSDLEEMMYRCGISTLELPDGIRVSIINIDRMKSLYFPDHNGSNVPLPADRFDSVCGEWNIVRGSRFNAFRTFKRQAEWIAGRVAFSAVDHINFGGGHAITHVDGGAPEIEGMPNPVSITHSGRYAAVAVSLSPDISLGIDLERIRSFDNRESFLRVAFPEDDILRLSMLPDNEILAMWTLKESFLKVLKLGFAENLRNVRILPDCFIYKGTRIDTLRREVTEFDGHILSAVWGTLP